MSAPWWWLSFATEEGGFQGACAVQAPSMELAPFEAHRQGCAAEGQVMILSFPPNKMPRPGQENKLMGEREARLFEPVTFHDFVVTFTSDAPDRS